MVRHGSCVVGGSVPDPAGRGYRPGREDGEDGPLDGLALVGREPRKEVSFSVHKVLAGIDNEAEGYAAIEAPPEGMTR